MWKFLILAVLGAVVSLSALAAASLMPGTSAAQPGTLYAVDGAGTQIGDCDGSLSNLYTMNPSTGAATLVGPIMINSTQARHVTAIAVHPSSGVLYGVMNGQEDDCSGRGFSTLLSINTSTAAATVIGSNGSLGHQIPDIDFDPSGQLYGWSEGTFFGPVAIPSGGALGTDDLITIDITNGTAAVVGDCGCTTSRTGLAIDSTGAMYMKSGILIFRMNPGSGTIITTLDLDKSTHNLLAFDPGDVLFTGFRNRIADTFILETINQTTGVVSDVGTTSVSHLISAIAFDRTPSVTRIWGDWDCDGTVGTRDSQALLRKVLEQNALSQTQPCPLIGTLVTVDGISRIWGDGDCDGTVGTRDSQAILRKVLEQNPLSQTQPCPLIGDLVQVSD